MRTTLLKMLSTIVLAAGLAVGAFAHEEPAFTTVLVGSGDAGSLTDNEEPGSYTVIGGGNDIWSGGDDFTFNYHNQEGDFDVRVRIESLEIAAQWTKAGLMARETLDRNSRMVFVRVTPHTQNGITGQNDVKFAMRTGTTAANRGEFELGSVPNGIMPGAWVRLQRSGNTFIGYYSANGLEWSELGRTDTATGDPAARETWVDPTGAALPATNNILLGLAVSRHSGTITSVRAEFRDYGDASNHVHISQQPASTSVNDGQVANFSARVAGGYDHVSLQWQQDGVNIPNATNRTLSITATEAMDGDAITLIVNSLSNGSSTVSSNATLSVTNPPPVVTGVSSRGNPGGFFVFFNEDVNATTALNPANYQVDGGVTVTGARFGANNRTVLLTTSPLTIDTTYNVTISGVTDASASGQVVETTTRAFTHGQDIPGRLSYTFNDGQVPPGATIGHHAVVTITNGVDDSGVLKLTEAANDQRGTFVTHVFAPGNSIDLFQVSFMMRVDSPQANPADGMGVSITGDAPAVPAANAFEEGQNFLGNGFYFTLDNWDSGGAEAPSLDIHWRGARVATRLIPKYNNPAFVPVTVTLKTGGLADLDFNGTNVFRNVVLPNFSPISNPRMAFGARTGGANERHYIDNIIGQVPGTLGPIVITSTSQSTNLIQENTQGPRLAVTGVDGTAFYSYQWYSNGVAIPNASASFYQVGTVFTNNDGDVYSVVVANEFSTATNNFTFDVFADVVQPTLVSASVSPSGRIELNFSEPMGRTSVTNELNYVVSGGVTVTSAALSANGRTAILTTSGLTAGTQYTVTATDIRDAQGNLTTPNPVVANVTAGTANNGVLLVEIFRGGDGTALSVMTNSAAFRDGRSTSNLFVNVSQYPASGAGDAGMDQYGVRMTGYIIPSTSGNYSFSIHSDDAGAVWVSPTSNPSDAQLVVREDGCCTERFGDQQGIAPMFLEAGRAYFIGALMREGGGGDYLRVRWRNRDTTTAYSLIPAANLAYYIDPSRTSINFTTPLADVTLEQGRTNIFNPGAVAITPVSPVNPLGRFTPAFQWQVSSDNGGTWTNIEGATGSTLTFTTALEQNGNQYRLVATTLGIEASTTPVTLTVLQDTTPPAIVKASLINGTNVYVFFNEILANDPASADDNVEEEFAWGLSLNGGDIFLPAVATVMSNGTMVKLELPAENAVTSGDLTVTLSTAADPFGNAITEALSSPVFVWNQSVVGLGNGAGLEEAIPLSADDISVSAGGGDTWGTSDNGTFVYEPRTGDFDVSMQLAVFPQWAHTVAKVGPMVRLSTNANSANVFLNNNPPTYDGGRGLTESALRPTAGAETGGAQGRAPAGTINTPEWQIPNSWLRLRRVGDQFIGYRSTNGTDWVMFAETFQAAWPDEALVGIEVTAQSGRATAIVSNYTDVVHAGAAINFTQNLPANVQIPVTSNGTVNIAYEITGAPANEAVVLWYFNGAVVANNVLNTGSSNSFTSGPLNVPQHDNGQLWAVINVSGLSVTTAVMTVDVVPNETVAPTVVSAIAAAGGTNITVNFSEAIYGAAANAAANYTVAGRTVTGARLVGSSQVILTVDTALDAGASYEVTASNIPDFPNGNIGGGTVTVVVKQPIQGLANSIIFEAEDFDNNLFRAENGGKAWVFANTLEGFSGSGYMIALPNSGTAIAEPNHVTQSPRLDYLVNFPEAGTYYVHVRGNGATGSDDSIHIGLNGASAIHYNWRLTGWTVGTNFTWARTAALSNVVARVDVATAGIHTFNLFMREDGTIVDRIFLTTDPNATGANNAQGQPDSGRSDLPDVGPVTLSVAKSGNTLNVTFTSQTGVMYQLQSRTAVDGTWADVTGATIVGTGSPVTLSDTAATEDTKFYRVTAHR